jgi:hypothetical protein
MLSLRPRPTLRNRRTAGPKRLQPSRCVAIRPHRSVAASPQVRSPSQRLVRATEATELARADSLLDRVRSPCVRSERLLTESEEILAGAKRSGQTADALNAIKTAAIAARELRSQLALLGEVSGELNKSTVVNIDAREGKFIVMPSVPDPVPTLDDGQTDSQTRLPPRAA